MRTRASSETEPASRPGALARLTAPLRKSWHMWLAIVATIVTGLPTGVATLVLSDNLDTLAASLLTTEPRAVYTFQIGLQVGLAALIGFAVTVGTPWLWRHAHSPALLRFIATTSVQGYALSLGLLFPPRTPGYIFAWGTGGVGVVIQWWWQRRWRGVGIAPTPLAGVLRPAIHPGQIWFATVVGAKETKVRPVVVLGPDEVAPRWKVAYCTTQEPRTVWLAEKYLRVPMGTVRGLSKENWVSITDLRALNRPQFRTYLGLVPDSLYQQLCTAADVAPAADARTIREDRAGQGQGPVETAIRQALGFDRSGMPPVVDNFTWETVKALLFMPLDPPDSR